MAAEQLRQQNDLSQLYMDHHSWLYQWLHRRLSCHSQAEDLAQDTFVRLLRSGTPDLQEPRAYLTTVAKGILINWYQRQSLERAYLQALEAIPAPEQPSEEHRYLILETLHEIDAVLDGLAAEVKQTFLLSQLEGLKYQQIADQLGVSLITVKRYMKKAFLHCLSVEMQGRSA